MSVTLIAAVASNGIIGKDNALIWRLPADLAYFKRQTLGKPVLMGRKTYESLGKPLPGRTNVVLSRTLAEAPEGCELVRSVPEALEKYAGEDLMVIGGADVYAQTLDAADRLLITRVDRAFEGDAYFPAFEGAAWKLVSDVPGVLDERNAIPHAFRVYERV